MALVWLLMSPSLRVPGLSPGVGFLLNVQRWSVLEPCCVLLSKKSHLDPKSEGH